ncbi:ASCH domain-containing protein [Lacticaseibacillus jixianensis]|uniref:ASCH domain-containing protein n=1 Tax=Lacticaseibacillus jixianensis TaxID=2486012 RepID=A0ABW4BDU3_9LACO|nr:ASCH domain-containing protein [Lacticaseibacillus jixianensis]
MKALSIRADYAWQILIGEKTSEYRSWPTKHRGDLLICSTAQRIAGTIPGHALCVVQIVDCIKLGPNSYEWKIGDGGFYIRPFPVKGKQRLFNIEDDLIVFDPITNETDEAKTDAWVRKYIDPLII